MLYTIYIIKRLLISKIDFKKDVNIGPKLLKSLKLLKFVISLSLLFCYAIVVFAMIHFAF